VPNCPQTRTPNYTGCVVADVFLLVKYNICFFVFYNKVCMFRPKITSNYKEIKSKFSLPAPWRQVGCRGIAPLIFDVGTVGRQMASFTLQPPFSRKLITTFYQNSPITTLLGRNM